MGTQLSSELGKVKGGEGEEWPQLAQLNITVTSWHSISQYPTGHDLHFQNTLKNLRV